MKTAILLLVMLGLFACQKESGIQPSGKTVSIGILAPLTGADNNAGQAGLNGIRIAQQIMPLLDNGDRIELRIMNDMSQPRLCTTKLDKLVEETQAVSIILLSDSGTVLACARRLEDHKIPGLAAFATNAGIVEKSRYISLLGFDDDFQGLVTALFVHDELLLDKIAVFSQADSVYSRDLANRFTEKFASVRGSITDNIQLGKSTAGLETILKKVKSSNPQLLYLPLDSQTIYRILKILGKIHWQPEILASDSFMRNAFDHNQTDISLLQGMMVTSMFNPSDNFSEFGKKAIVLYRREYGKADNHAMLGMEAYALIVHVLNACNNHADRECINERLHGVDDFTGVQNRISINREGKASRPLYVNKIDGDSIDMLVKVY